MSEQDRMELQKEFEKHTGTKVINSQGEFDIDYISWLEDKLIPLIPHFFKAERIEPQDIWSESFEEAVSEAGLTQGVIEVMKAFACVQASCQPSAGNIDSDFLKYINNAKEDFIKQSSLIPLYSKDKVIFENFVIAYDQMKDKLTQTGQPQGKEDKEYEYEMFFKSEESDGTKIDGWYPIATDRIRDITKIEHYLKTGLLRKI